MRRKQTSRNGLTLVEVLVALVILSAGVSAMMGAMSRCLAVVRTIRNREISQGLLRRVDLEFPIEKVDMADLTETGEFEDVEGYAWSREIIMVDEEERPGLFLVSTRISWSERGREAFEEINTYEYAPEAESLTQQF